jgi:hypothetical protein
MLMMDDSQVYSWYHVFPKNAQLNSRADYSTSILPAIFFEEYAQVWGSKAIPAGKYLYSLCSPWQIRK